MNGHKVLQYPSICIIGYIGAGKTAVATFINALFTQYCDELGLQNYKVFANFTMELDRFKKVKARDIVTFPDWLRDGILTLDEIHSEGGDSYNFLAPISKKLTTFFSQIRKRNLAVITTSQDFTMVNSRIRKLTYYYLHVVELPEGKRLIRVVGRDGLEVIKEFEIDITTVYDLYDTNEVITDEEIKELETITIETNKNAG